MSRSLPKLDQGSAAFSNSCRTLYVCCLRYRTIWDRACTAQTASGRCSYIISAGTPRFAAITGITGAANGHVRKDPSKVLFPRLSNERKRHQNRLSFRKIFINIRKKLDLTSGLQPVSIRAIKIWSSFLVRPVCKISLSPSTMSKAFFARMSAMFRPGIASLQRNISTIPPSKA